MDGYDLTDELVELYIHALINVRAWQKIALVAAQGGISSHTLENAQQPHQQALEPLLREYKQSRQGGSDPETAFQTLLAKLQKIPPQ